MLTLTTAPAATPVSLSELKAHLRVSNTRSDDYLTACIAAATARLDGIGGDLRRALITQAYTLRLDDWPARKFCLPMPPLIEIASIKYYDEDDVLQTFASSNYRVFTPTGAAGYFELTDEATWPVKGTRAGSVEIAFTAGYGAAGTDVPAQIRQAILMIASDMYFNRGDGELAAATPGATSTTELAIERLIGRFKWREFA